MKRLEAVVMETRLLPISSVFGRFPRLLRGVARRGGQAGPPGDERGRDSAGQGGARPAGRAAAAPAHQRRGARDRDARRAAGGGQARGGRAAAGAPSRAPAGWRSSWPTTAAGWTSGGSWPAPRSWGSTSAGEDERSPRADLPARLLAPPSGVGRWPGAGWDWTSWRRRSARSAAPSRCAPGRDEGIAFLLDIPLTLAIVRSLIVEVDQERYAVPIAQVAATVRAEPQALHEINHAGVALWRGDAHPGDRRRAPCWAPAPGPTRGRRFYVVISSGARRRGILVDRLIGHQDVVVKGLDPSLGRPDVVSGTTILGDGRVACILDAGADPRAAGAGVSDALLRFADELGPARGPRRSPPRSPSCTWSPSPSIGRSYGVPVQRVREVIRVGEITRVPQAPAHVRGVTNLRGRILPVVELRTRLGPHAGGAHAQEPDRGDGGARTDPGPAGGRRAPGDADPGRRASSRRPEDILTPQADWLAGVARRPRPAADPAGPRRGPAACNADIEPRDTSMAGRLEQMIKDWTIRRKILTGFCGGAGLHRGARLARAPGARPDERRLRARSCRAACRIGGGPDLRRRAHRVILLVMR